MLSRLASLVKTRNRSISPRILAANCLESISKPCVMGFEQLAGRRRYLAGVWPILCYTLVRPDPSTEGFERRS
jgi:hypothetical protein